MQWTMKRQRKKSGKTITHQTWHTRYRVNQLTNQLIEYNATKKCTAQTWRTQKPNKNWNENVVFVFNVLPLHGGARWICSLHQSRCPCSTWTHKLLAIICSYIFQSMEEKSNQNKIKSNEKKNTKEYEP